MTLTIFGTVISKSHSQMTKELTDFWNNKTWENFQDENELIDYLSSGSFNGREGTVINLPYNMINMGNDENSSCKLPTFCKNYESQVDWTMIDPMKPFVDIYKNLNDSEPENFVCRHETSFVTADINDSQEEYLQYYLKGHPVLVLQDNSDDNMKVATMNSFNDMEIIEIPKSTIQIMTEQGLKTKSSVALILEGGAKFNIQEQFPHPAGTGYVYGNKQFEGDTYTEIAQNAYKYYIAQDVLNRNTKIIEAVLLDINDISGNPTIPFDDLSKVLVRYWASLLLKNGSQLDITEPFMTEDGSISNRYIEFDCMPKDAAIAAYQYYLSLHPSNIDTQIDMILIKVGKHDSNTMEGYKFNEYDPATNQTSYVVNPPIKIDTTVFNTKPIQTQSEMIELLKTHNGTLAYFDTSVFKNGYVELTNDQKESLDNDKIKVDNLTISQLRIIPYATTDLILDKWAYDFYGKLVNVGTNFHGLVSRYETSFLTYYTLKKETAAHYDEVLLRGHPVLITDTKGKETQITYINPLGNISSMWIDSDVISKEYQPVPLVLYPADPDTYMPKEQDDMSLFSKAISSVNDDQLDEMGKKVEEKVPVATTLFSKQDKFEVFETDIQNTFIVFFEGVPTIQNVIFDFENGDIRSTLQKFSKKDLPKSLFNFDIFSEALWEKGITANPPMIRNVIDPTEKMQLIFVNSLSSNSIMDENSDDDFDYNDFSPIKNIVLTDTVQMAILHKELSEDSINHIKNMSVKAQEYLVKRLMPRAGDIDAEESFKMVSYIKDMDISVQQYIVDARIDLAKYIIKPDKSIINQCYQYDYIDSDHETEQFIKIMYALADDEVIQVYLKMKYSYILTGYDEIPEQVYENPTPELIARYYEKIDDKALALTFMRKTTDPMIRRYLMEKFSKVN